MVIALIGAVGALNAVASVAGAVVPPIVPMDAIATTPGTMIRVSGAASLVPTSVREAGVPSSSPSGNSAAQAFFDEELEKEDKDKKGDHSGGRW